MTDKKISCLACGVFKMELAALTQQGKLDCDIIALESMLHIKPAKLEQEMERAMATGPKDKFLILYGDCHPGMHEMRNRENASGVVGINCCDILLGREAYRKLQKDQAVIFLPEWTLRWQDLFTRELGFEKPEVAQAFMKEHRKRLVYADTGVIPLPEKTLRDISGFFDMPVEIQPISLDILLLKISNALRKFTRRGQHDND
ncbi:MAG: DUF1638 domain-containing protein [Pseudomonadota bacterium]